MSPTTSLVLDARAKMARVHADAESDYHVEMLRAADLYDHAIAAAAAARLTAERAAEAKREATRDVATREYEARRSRLASLERMQTELLLTAWRRYRFHAGHAATAHAQRDAEFMRDAAAGILAARGAIKVVAS